MLAQDVDHNDRGPKGRIPERQIAYGPNVLLELRGGAGLHRIMPRIMRTRGEFVDEQFPVLRQKHFDRQQADGFHRFGNPGGQALGLPQHRFLDAGRDDGQVQNIVHMNVLRHGKRADFPVRAAGSDDRQFLDERDELLQDKFRARAAQLGICRIDLLVGPDDPLAFTVVTAGGRLQDRRQAQAPDGLPQLLFAADLRIRRHPGTGGLHRALLAQAMLRSIQQPAALRHVRLLLEQRRHLGVHVLEFVRDDIGALRQLARRLLVPVAGDDLLRYLAARRFRRRIERDEAVAQIAAGERHHAAELASAQYADRRAGTHLTLPLLRGYRLAGSRFSFAGLRRAPRLAVPRLCTGGLQ
ncbi:hypothetical protein D1872_225080 [compost metagenome]